MLIISQHARLLKIDFPDYAVFRVNIAWVKSNEELHNLLSQIKGDVFLDFPEGRIKPPRPILNFDDLLVAMEKFDNIKYFGVTNVKKPSKLTDRRDKLPSRILLVPKIESKEGIDNLEDILEVLRKGEDYIMLDKEDLYTDLGDKKELFEDYIQMAREKCKKNNTHVLELQGVIFS